MPHTDPEILALRAIGESAGSAAEEEHIAGCADCRAELAQLKDVVATARQDGPVPLEQPPARIWDQIAAAAAAQPLSMGAPPTRAQPAPETMPRPGRLQPTAGNGRVGRAGPSDETPGRAERGLGLGAARPDGTPGPAERGLRRGSARRSAARPGRMRARLAIAAAAGIVIGAGAAVGIARLVSAPGSAAPGPAAAAIARVPLRPLPQFPQWRGASGTAVMRLASATRVLDVTLSAPPKPGFYEVWLLGRDGVSMISLGDLSSGHTGSFTVPPGADLTFYSRIDVSLQPFDGITVHSKTSVVRGSLPGAVTGGS